MSMQKRFRKKLLDIVTFYILEDKSALKKSFGLLALKQEKV